MRGERPGWPQSGRQIKLHSLQGQEEGRPGPERGRRGSESFGPLPSVEPLCHL